MRPAGTTGLVIHLAARAARPSPGLPGHPLNRSSTGSLAWCHPGNRPSSAFGGTMQIAGRALCRWRVDPGHWARPSRKLLRKSEVLWSVAAMVVFIFNRVFLTALPAGKRSALPAKPPSSRSLTTQSPPPASALWPRGTAPGWPGSRLRQGPAITHKPNGAGTTLRQHREAHGRRSGPRHLRGGLQPGCNSSAPLRKLKRNRHRAAGRGEPVPLHRARRAAALAFQNTERNRGIPRVKAAQGGCLLPRANWTVNVTRPTADAT